MSLQISQIRIRLTNAETDKEPLAWVSCIVNNALCLNNIAIRKSRTADKPRLVFPAKKSGGGKTYYYFNPINDDARLDLEEAILTQLEEIIQPARGRE